MEEPVEQQPGYSAMNEPEDARMRLATHRHRVILDQLHRQGAVVINHLAESLHVSAMTIRRDLDEMSKQGLLRRTHGGAVSLAERRTQDPPFGQRRQFAIAEKQAIARQAAAYIGDGDRIILDSGSTVAALASFLGTHKRTTVITYSLPVLHELSGQLGNRLVCTGGACDTEIHALVGPLAEQMLNTVRVDKAFLGATSVSVEDGFSNSHLTNLALQRIVLAVAREVYLLVDSSKFQQSPFWLVAPVDTLTAIITDSGVSTATVESFSRAGIQVDVVDGN
jgi:DeoR/GlpR family transcriptional regulator of sugar metabolism